MSREEYASEVAAYKTTMTALRALVSQGAVTREDYANIDTIIAKQHGLSLGSIFLENP